MINIIKFKLDEHPIKFKKDINSYILTIDGQDLWKLISETALENGFLWQEASNSTVCLEELHASLLGNGNYSILVSSHCLFHGMKEPMDINLSSISSYIQNDIVKWEFKVFSNKGNSAHLSFQFHRPQLEKAIKPLPFKTLKTY